MSDLCTRASDGSVSRIPIDSSSKLPLTAGYIRAMLQCSKGFSQRTERLQAIGHVDLCRRLGARAPQLLQAAHTRTAHTSAASSPPAAAAAAAAAPPPPLPPTHIVCIIPHQQRTLYSPQVAPRRQHALRPTRVTSRAQLRRGWRGAHSALGCSECVGGGEQGGYAFVDLGTGM
jgi:hypothetical protein